MKKYSFILILTFAFVFAFSAHAQEGEAAPIAPPSFFGLVAEGFGTFFTFGNAAKAERYLLLAERRLAEAEVLAGAGDERAEVAVRRFEAQIARAGARAERADDVDLIERVADNTTRHISVLDEVLARVSEEARDAIEIVKARAIADHVSSLRALGEIAPERAVDVFSRAAEARLRTAETRANRGGEGETEDVEEALSEYEKYAEFGREISTLGQGLRTGETTVEELIKRAGEQHLRVLQNVEQRVPFEAQDGIRRAIENAEAVRDARPVSPDRLESGETRDIESARARLLTPSQRDDAPARPEIQSVPVRTDALRDRIQENRVEERKVIEPTRTAPTLTPSLPARTPVQEERKDVNTFVPEPTRSIEPTRIDSLRDEAPVAPTQTITPAPTTSVTPIPTTSVAPARVEAAIQGFAFAPGSLTVKKGTTVVWTNKDSVGHTVTGGEKGPDSRLLGQGESYSFTFNTAGTFNYSCTSHPNMRGVVTVVE